MQWFVKNPAKQLIVAFSTTAIVTKVNVDSGPIKRRKIGLSIFVTFHYDCNEFILCLRLVNLWSDNLSLCTHTTRALVGLGYISLVANDYNLRDISVGDHLFHEDMTIVPLL